MIEYRRVFSIDRNAAECVEGFPSDARRIRDPILVLAGIATGLFSLLDQTCIGRQKLRTQSAQFVA